MKLLDTNVNLVTLLTFQYHQNRKQKSICLLEGVRTKKKEGEGVRRKEKEGEGVRRKEKEGEGRRF